MIFDVSTLRKVDFNKLTVLEMGPLRFSKGDIYKTFPAEKVTFFFFFFIKVTFLVGNIL